VMFVANACQSLTIMLLNHQRDDDHTSRDRVT
jgi:hypothetical protein